MESFNNMDQMNIVEAYIKFKGQLIIFITGISGCGKNKLAKSIANELNLKLFDQNEYYIPDFNKQTKLINGQTVVNWYDDDAIDWNKLNKDIEESKQCVVTGMSISKITLKPDYHIHINLSKQKCIEKRRRFLTKYKEHHQQEYAHINSQMEKSIMNTVIYPYILEKLKESKVNFYINADDKTFEQILQESLTNIFAMISDFLYTDNNATQTIESGDISLEGQNKMTLFIPNETPTYLAASPIMEDYIMQHSRNSSTSTSSSEINDGYIAFI